MARDVNQMYTKIFEMLAMVGRMGKPTDFDKRALDWQFQFLSKNLRSGHILCNLLDEVTSGCFIRRKISIDASSQVETREESSRRNARNFFNVLAEEFAYINSRIGETDLFTLPLLPKDDVKRDYLLELLCSLSAIPEMERFRVTKIQHFPVTSQFRSRPKFDFNGDLGEIGVPYDPVASDFYNEVPPTPYDEVPEDDEPPAIPPRPLSTLSRLSVMDADVPIPVYDANPSDLYTVLMSPYDMDGLGGDVEEDGSRMGAYMGQQQIYGIPGQIEIRTRIIDELVSSELTYLSLLRDIAKYWIVPLSQILSEKDMEAVFMNIMKIKEIHENFYKDIKRESEKQFESRKISDCFRKMMSNLLEYKEYLTKIESAKDKMKLIERDADRNPAYKRALHVIRTNAEQSRIICKREVQEALVIPMERLCRYPLFVERLINKSGAEHPDYDNLKIVFELLKEINSYVNACSGDNTGILERAKISRRTGVQTKEFGFPLRTKDKTQYKEGLNADKVSKDGEKINWEKIEVFVFHTALIIVGLNAKACKYQINVIKFEHILNAGDNKPEVSQPEESKAVLRQRSQWKVRVKTTYGRSINYEIKFPTEQFAKTFHARLSNVYQTYTKNMKQGWSAFNIPLGYNCQNYFPQISCCKICKKLFNGLEMQGFRSTKFPNIYVHEGCIENVQTYKRPETNPYSLDPTEADNFHDRNHRELKEKPYYVGMMERDQARRILEQSSAGQFLVRDRAGADVKQAPYAVSMVTWEKKQRHMKIFQEKSSTSLRPKYYFCEQHKYSSPVELINAFSFEKDLNDAFNDLRGNFTGPARIPDHLRVN